MTDWQTALENYHGWCIDVAQGSNGKWLAYGGRRAGVGFFTTQPHDTREAAIAEAKQTVETWHD
jgi:hypothetical protein